LLGSAFAISRTWWEQGRYDPGFEVWGIENIELSVRTWTCGGSVVFHPCSHVGHYYRATRENPQQRWQQQNFLAKNSIRFAEVQYLFLFPFFFPLPLSFSFFVLPPPPKPKKKQQIFKSLFYLGMDG